MASQPTRKSSEHIHYAGNDDVADYEAWYHTPRGQWIADSEFDLLLKQLSATPGQSLLDVGCGSGHFSRRLARQHLSVSAIDPDSRAIAFAKQQPGHISYQQGNALALPFADQAFDHSIAITSLCFIQQPQLALAEMWRVSRQTVTLGLLNRHSLLHRLKQGHGRYKGARWDTANEVLNKWMPLLSPAAKKITLRSAIFFPQGKHLAQYCEKCIPRRFLYGGFLLINLCK